MVKLQTLILISLSIVNYSYVMSFSKEENKKIYELSKEEIIKIIESNPELKKAVEIKFNNELSKKENNFSNFCALTCYVSYLTFFYYMLRLSFDKRSCWPMFLTLCCLPKPLPQTKYIY